MDIQDLSATGATLLPFLWALGVLLKNTPRVANWIIPWILTAAGMLSGLCLQGLRLEAIIDGAMAGLAAVGGHQVWKQTADQG